MTYEKALNILDETVTGNLEWKIVLTKALEKQIPKKPIPTIGKHTKTIIYFSCPNCGASDLGNNEYRFNCCENCGQKLNWEET